MASGGELQRQAEERELLAARFDKYAQDLGTLFDQIKTGSVEGGPIWTGPAAQRFERESSLHRSDIDRLIEQCLLSARNLRSTAQRMRKEAEQVTASP
ncbi:hypothetical protein GCM10022226_63970 [Sphaerisporangium flaviroseum]|uniref:WXG100 family type VII secretion target n=1 Tax=Sphaerisporangium flaviroseum TaxID=509199 RepID=A0ABP7J3F5_9ACTN